MIRALGGRKFILAMFIVATTSIMLLLTRVDQEVYKFIILSITGGYLTSNVAQKTIGAINAGKN